MLVEAALLDQCALAGGPFGRNPSVFSQVLVSGESKKGIVQPYFRWWKRRQHKIRQRCEMGPDDVVVYFDLKKFYPSISHDLASISWRAAANTARLGVRWTGLGERILTSYQQLLPGGGLPMGPMFAHIIANSVLFEFDRVMGGAYPLSYFRYVDDIALVIPASQIEKARKQIQSILPAGLKLNESKQLDLVAELWAKEIREFPKTLPIDDWMWLVTAVKRYILHHPTKTLDL
jgi:hypothetical protein